MLFLSLILTSCASPATTNTVTSPIEGKKVAYIINIPQSEIFTLCANQCVETSKKLGMTCDTYYSNGNDEAFKQKVKEYADKNYDGLFLSHGGREYSYNLITDIINEHKKS